MAEKIIIGCDHAGLNLKNKIKQYLELKNIEVFDAGTYTAESCDYPLIAKSVAQKVAENIYEKGILVCGTGIGMSITANKVKGIRAAVGMTEECVKLSRKHNDVNILCLGGRTITEKDAKQFIKMFLNTPFDGERHSRRIAQIKKIENCEIL